MKWSLLALLGAAAVTWAAASSSTARKMTLVSLNLASREAVVELQGFVKAPPANLFTFTDERQRHFVAQTARCSAGEGKGAWRCVLEIPRGYERHKLATMGVHVGTLKGRQLFVDEAEVARVWEAATSEPGARDGGS